MWQSQSAASARGQPFFACEMLRHHASCGRCHRGAPAGTSAMRRAVDGAAPPLFLQVPGPRGAEEVARAHATATQTPCTHGYVETGRRWFPSRWSRRLVAVPDSSCLQRSSPGSVLVASAQFVGARCFDVAAPRFEARPSRRRRRKDEELLGAFGSATWTTTAVSVPTLELSFRRCIRDY